MKKANINEKADMNQDENYLHLLFNEEIYVINEPLKDPVEQLKDHIESREDKPTAPKLTYKGKNKKGVIMLINHADVQYLNDQQEQLINNILKSVNLSFDDIGLVNLHHFKNNIYLEDLLELNCHYFIGFGIPASVLSKERNLISHEVFTQKNIKILLTYSLDELNNDRNKKISLWNNLKKMFLK